MNASFKRFIRIIGKIVMSLLIFVLLSWVIAAVFLFFMFGRRDVPEVGEAVYDEALMASCPREEHVFSSNGNKLHGWLYDRPENRGLVVVVHGIGGGADSFLYLIERFCGEGYDVFAFDGTGSRSSDGSGIRGLSQAAVDLNAALAHLEREAADSYELPLILFGHSAGGYAAAVNAADHPEVDGVICISAFDRPIPEMLIQAKKRAGIFAYLGYPGLFMHYHLLFGPDANRSASEALLSSDVPALIIAGSKDTVVPYDVGLYAGVEETRDPDASFWLIKDPPQNGHSGLWLTDRAMQLRNNGNELTDLPACNEPDEAFMGILFDFMDRVTKEAVPDHGAYLEEPE